MSEAIIFPSVIQGFSQGVIVRVFTGQQCRAGVEFQNGVALQLDGAGQIATGWQINRSTPRFGAGLDRLADRGGFKLLAITHSAVIPHIEDCLGRGGAN